MRISMISEHASPLAPLGSVDAGGQNVHVDKLAAELTLQGHDVTVFTRRDDPEPPDVVTMASGTRVVHISTGEDRHVPKDELLEHMPEFGHGIARYWTAYADVLPDVVHSHFWMSALAARTALESARCHGVPLLHTYHALGTVKRRYQGSADTSPAERIRLEKTIGDDASRIIATCQDEKDELAAMGIDISKVAVIPCGVDLSQFSPGTGPSSPGTGPSSPGTGPSSPDFNQFSPARIVCLGRLVPRKGLDLVIRGVAELNRRGGGDVVVDIIGGSADGGEFASDPEVRRLRSLAAELGVQDQVNLCGHMDRADVPAAIRSASIVACTPWYEPFGIVPLEAMACGVPVIAAAVGGLQNTVVDGSTGLLVTPGDVDAFASAAERILSSADFARSLGQAGIERARERYTWAAVAAQTEEVYEDARTLTDDKDETDDIDAANPEIVAASSEPFEGAFGKDALLGAGLSARMSTSMSAGMSAGMSAQTLLNDSDDVLTAQLRGVSAAVSSLHEQLCTLRHWSGVLARTLTAGGTLFCAGNGGSAAEAQHLSAELVGRYAGERPAFSSIALNTDSSAVTAIGNDYGFDNVFARQIEAHARPGDILILLSTSGRSPNLVRAAEAANRIGVTTWALAGPDSSPLTQACDTSIRVDAEAPHVQEAHLMAVHCLCAAFDDYVSALSAESPVRATGADGSSVTGSEPSRARAVAGAVPVQSSSHL